MNIKNVVDGINQRFSNNFGWPEGFVVARETGDGGFVSQIGYGDVQFDKDGKCLGGGTDLTGKWDIDIKLNENPSDGILETE